MWIESRSKSGFVFSFSILISFFFAILVTSASQKIKCPVQRLYQLGDSIADTGNTIRILNTTAAARPPYGITFPGFPTGRWSDGRLIIDYIAMNLGLPLLNPYLARSASFENGVNFAVGGSTALNSTFFQERRIRVFPVPSLRVQLDWFRRYLTSICSSPTDCAEKLNASLVFVGEIGYNDIGLPIYSGKSLKETQSYVPLVTQVALNTTRDIIQAGASQVIVPGNFPLGCFPFALSILGSNDSTTYDELGCLKSVNNLTTIQNNLLQDGLESLRGEFPNTVILYADYYNAFLSVLRNASNLGFDSDALFKACCGFEGRYDPFGTRICGNSGLPLCRNRNRYIHWDGIHLTQEAYGRIYEILIKDLGINCT